MGRSGRGDSSRKMRKGVNWIVAVFVLLVFTVGCNPTPQPTGTLRGRVTIGPLVPVLQEGEPEPTPAPEVYAARKILIFKSNGNRLVAEAEIDPQGNYAVELPAGIYLVDINHHGIDTAAGLPAEVVIREGAVTFLDVDIDTGIR